MQNSDMIISPYQVSPDNLKCWILNHFSCTMYGIFNCWLRTLLLKQHKTWLPGSNKCSTTVPNLADCYLTKLHNSHKEKVSAQCVSVFPQKQEALATTKQCT